MCLLESADFLAAPFWQLAALALRALAFRFGVLRIPRFELRPRGREDFDRFPAMGAEIRRTTSLTNVVTDVIRTCRPQRERLAECRASSTYGHLPQRFAAARECAGQRRLDAGRLLGASRVKQRRVSSCESRRPQPIPTLWIRLQGEYRIAHPRGDRTRSYVSRVDDGDRRRHEAPGVASTPARRAVAPCPAPARRRSPDPDQSRYSIRYTTTPLTDT